jgi:Xaa-Pro aminopeptidase
VARHRKIAAAAGEGVELVAAGGLVEELRTVKDEAEVTAIAAAASLADSALLAVLERGLAGRTEREVATDLEIEMRRAGAQGLAFSPIVAAGAHGALPHAEPREETIPEGVLVTIDWGAELDGYCSDCTRTFATGEIGETEREVYELVLAAEEAALSAARGGITGRDLDAVARTMISEAGHGERFGHGLGHGVGIEVHEGPRLSTRSDDELRPGQVVTIEPGVYLPGVCGVRIEDLVVLRADGCDALTGLPKHLQTIG